MKKINATPSDLATVVFNRFKNLKNQSNKPSEQILVNLFESLFFASLKTEESNFTKVTVTLINSQNPDPKPPKRKVKHNSILYSTVRPNLCHFGLIKKPPKNLIVSTGFVVIDTTDKLLAEYIFLFLTSNELIQYFQSKAEMSVSTYPSIKPEDIQESKILIPEDRVLNNLKQVLEPLYILQLNKNDESKNLLLLKETLLSKMAIIED